MEGDCKNFFDAVNGVNRPWKIDTLFFDSKLLSLEFNLCCFCWVRREDNNVAHTLPR